MFGENKVALLVATGAIVLGAAVWKLFKSNDKET